MKNQPRRQLSDPERDRLLDDLKTKDKAAHDVAALMLATGMRLGEAFALQWPDVDYEGRRIHVRGMPGRDIPLTDYVCQLIGGPKQRGFVVPISRQKFLRIFCSVAPSDLRTHELRLNFARDFVKRGGSPMELFKLMGFRSSSFVGLFLVKTLSSISRKSKKRRDNRG